LLALFVELPTPNSFVSGETSIRVWKDIRRSPPLYKNTILKVQEKVTVSCIIRDLETSLLNYADDVLNLKPDAVIN